MLDFVLMAGTIALVASALLYGVACGILMRSDSTRDRSHET